VVVRYRDLDGAVREERAEGFRAACLQHEIDQLDGVFWIERLSRLRRERVLKRFAKLRDAG
jgi:peptide deformylase